MESSLGEVMDRFMPFHYPYKLNDAAYRRLRAKLLEQDVPPGYWKVMQAAMKRLPRLHELEAKIEIEPYV